MEREYGKVILCNKLVLTLVLLALLTAAEAVVGLVHEAAAAARRVLLLGVLVLIEAVEEVHGGGVYETRLRDGVCRCPS